MKPQSRQFEATAYITGAAVVGFGFLVLLFRWALTGVSGGEVPPLYMCVAVAAFAVAMLAFYLVPAIVALSRRHPNAVPIVCLNLLVGWTFIGYVAALVWSLTAVERRR